MTATHAALAAAIAGQVVGENTISVDGGYVYLGIKDWRAVLGGHVHTLASWRADVDEIALAYFAAVLTAKAAAVVRGVA